MHDLSIVRLITIGISLAIGVLAFVLKAKTRSWTHPGESGSGLLFNIRSYAFAHVFSFSDWFDYSFFKSSSIPYNDPPRSTFGFWTFMAIGKIIDPSYYALIPPGYYNEYFNKSYVVQSNIYTVFRGLIYDFTLPGSFVFMLVFGWLSCVFYKSMLLKRRPPASHAFYIFLIGYIYSSYLISLLIWSSAYAAAIGVLVILVLIERRGGDETAVEAPARTADKQVESS